MAARPRLLLPRRPSCASLLHSFRRFWRCLYLRRSSLEPRATTRLQRPGPSPLRTQHRTTLRNGGVVRGTVVSSSPGEEVTILVPGSDKPRRISWAEVGDVQLGKHAPKSDSAPGSAGPGYGGSEPTRQERAPMRRGRSAAHREPQAGPAARAHRDERGDGSLRRRGGESLARCLRIAMRPARGRTQRSALRCRRRRRSGLRAVPASCPTGRREDERGCRQQRPTRRRRVAHQSRRRRGCLRRARVGPRRGRQRRCQHARLGRSAPNLRWHLTRCRRRDPRRRHRAHCDQPYQDRFRARGPPGKDSARARPVAPKYWLGQF